MQQKPHSYGFSVIEFIIILAVGALIAAGVWYATHPRQKTENSSGQNSISKKTDQKSAQYVEWEFDGTSWRAMGEAPVCESPLKLTSPADTSVVTAKLWPGQVRGNDFKAHGGLSVEGATSNKIEITAMRDAYLFRGSRYVEQGETQYMFDFIDPCGVMYRYDHLLTLSKDFAGYADALPPARADDSRTEKISLHPFIKAGTVVASEVGFVETKNVFVDVGVYDLRAPNEVSKTSLYKTDSGRLQDKQQSYYGLCWFDLLPASDKAVIEKLPARDGTSAQNSDYCKK